MNHIGGGGTFGKYKGSCVNNSDPKGLGRIRCKCADLYGDSISNWAMPCLPVAGLQSGMYLVPPVNAGVWVECEQGDLEKPIWSGCFWRFAEEVPALARTPKPDIVVQSTGFPHRITYSITVSDATGIRLASSDGAVIAIDATGITLSNGKGATIKLTGKSVAINGNALIVT